jgi:serine/threonine protein kinase
MTSQPDSAATFWVGPEEDPDRYSLGSAVGSGAEGILYRGSITTGTGVELEVAIKMLQPRFLDRVDEWHGRWREQGELVRSLHVPGVVPVRDGFIGPMPHPRGRPGEGRTLYLVMNWIEGEPVDEWVRHRPDRDPLDDLKVLVQVAAALDLMHSGRATGSVPIIHRDIKPSNILITERGAVLVDFGLTRGLPTGQQLTGITGTPGYMAPEVLDEGLYSPASDRYAFGAVAFFIVTGQDLPKDESAEAIRELLIAVPAFSDRPDLVDHLMAMLDADPGQRPSGLANWLGLVRNSSLLLRSEDLTPPAPARHVEPSKKATVRGHRPHKLRRRTALLAVGVLLVALAAGGLLAGHWLSGPAATSAPLRFSGAFDPTCGGGTPVPLPQLAGSMPAAFAVTPSGAVLASLPPRLPPGFSDVPPSTELYSFNADCSLNEGFYLTPNPSTPSQTSFAITSVALADHGGTTYAAGHDQYGWVIAKYQQSGALDTSFGKGGLVMHPEFGAGLELPNARGSASAILATPSRVYVAGNSGGGLANSRTVIVSLLRRNGTLNPQFNRTGGTKGIRAMGMGDEAGQVMTTAPYGALLVGTNYLPEGIFTVDEYTPFGERVSSFKPICMSGTGTGNAGTGNANCVGPRIPGFTSAQLTSLIALPDGKFAGVGDGFTPGYSGITAPASGGFIARFESNGVIDATFGHNGVATLPSLQGAVPQPSGGFVVAMVKAMNVYLVYVTPSGRVGRQVLAFHASSPPTIATGDASGGKIEIVTFSSSEYSIGRYLGVVRTNAHPSG